MTEKKKGFDYGNEFPFLFSLQMNSGERERERARAREGEALRAVRDLGSVPFTRGRSTSRRRSQAPASSIVIRDRDLAFAPIAIGAVLARSRLTLREIAIDASQDRVADRDLAKRRGASRDRDRRRGHDGFVQHGEIASVERQSGFCPGWRWVCLFLVAFSKHQKIFFEKFFEIQRNT